MTEFKEVVCYELKRCKANMNLINDMLSAEIPFSVTYRKKLIVVQFDEEYEKVLVKYQLEKME